MRTLPAAKRLLKLVIGGAILYLLIRFGNIDFSALEILATRPLLVAAAVAAIACSICFSAIRWLVLLRVAGIDLGLFTVFRITMIGLFFAVALPGVAGADGARALCLYRLLDSRRAAAMMALVVDRLFSLFGLLGFAALLLAADRDLILKQSALSAYAQYVLILLGGGLVVSAAGYVTLRKFLGFPFMGRLPAVGKHMDRIRHGLRLYEARPGAVAMAAMLSLAACGMVAVAIVALGNIFPFGPGPAVGAVAGTLANLSQAVPLTPGGIGVAEAAYAWIAKILTGREAAFATIYLAFRLVMTCVSLAGSIFYMSFEGRRAKPALERPLPG